MCVGMRRGQLHLPGVTRRVGGAAVQLAGEIAPDLLEYQPTFVYPPLPTRRWRSSVGRAADL